jgi:hypothetical protein
MAVGEGVLQTGHAWGRDGSSLSLQRLEWSGRPFAEVQTRRARAARPSIVAGANEGLSETKGFSG